MGLRHAFVAFVLACAPALASEPGQFLDCSDVVFYAPGLTCQPFVPIGAINANNCLDDLWNRSSNLATDNTGALLYATANNYPLEIRRRSLAGDELIASWPGRPSPFGWDGMKPRSNDGIGGCDWPKFVPAGVQFDAAHGRLLVWVMSTRNVLGGGTEVVSWIASINGFATTFEVLQTFTPQASLGFRVPYMPEGMPAADSFDTYYGPLTKPINFAQAQPLACDYPATPPSVGDYLTVADPLPNPVSGTGRYYITAATYQRQTRYGRKTTAGVLSGRDPALLPACESP